MLDTSAMGYNVRQCGPGIRRGLHVFDVVDYTTGVSIPRGERDAAGHPVVISEELTLQFCL